jgi:hypothetical protein
MTENRYVQPNPFVGPRPIPFGERLWGRDQEVHELLDLIIIEPVVLLSSPSGAGTTSLLQAGLIPLLEAEGFANPSVIRVGLEPPVYQQDFEPANRYVLSSLMCLEQALPWEEERLSLPELAALSLGDYLDHRDAKQKEPAIRVLIFDQFEQILTLDPADLVVKQEFFGQMGTALRGRPRRALFAFREEYLAGLTSYLGRVFRRRSPIYRLELLGPEAAIEAIRRPAEEAGVVFQDEAAQRLVDDLRAVCVHRLDGTRELRPGPAVEPVQIQVVAHRLWEMLPPGSTQITEADIQTVGDVDRSLSDFYASMVASIAAEYGVPERSIRDWFDRELITPLGTRDMVQQQPEQSAGLDNTAIWALVGAHLVRAESRRGTTWFELAHDRFIGPVREDNAAWFEASLSPLQHQASLWDQQARPEGLLLRDRDLYEAEAWARDHLDELTIVEMDFLERGRVMARMGRSHRLVTMLVIVVIIALIVGIVIWLSFAGR